MTGGASLQLFIWRSDVPYHPLLTFPRSFPSVYLGILQYGVYVKGFEYLFNKKVINRFCNAPFREKLKDKEVSGADGGANWSHHPN